MKVISFIGSGVSFAKAGFNVTSATGRVTQFSNWSIKFLVIDPGIAEVETLSV